MGRKHKFIMNAAVLTVSSILLRFLGLWFRSVITGRIGASGMGLYQLIFSIFLLGITVCTSGFGLAMTRLVAEGRGSRGCVLRCLALALALSGAALGALFAGADFISLHFIRSPLAVRPLRILALGLPFIACCACLKGYFFALRNTVIPVLGDFWEQTVTIAVSLVLMDRSPLPPLESLMAGSTLGEVASILYLVPVFLHYTRKHGMAESCGGVMGSIVHIAGPMLAGSFLRNGLASAENVLIPIGLQKNGAGGTAALAQYGVVQGMVMPILSFPMSLISSAAMLLIPEIAEATAHRNPRSVRRSAEYAFRYTLLFGFPAAAVFLVFAGELGTVFFGSEQAAQILRIVAPLAPLMYVDNVVDNLLKGLDQQMYSLKINLCDSLMRVALIAVLVPRFGIRAYLVILFASEIFNASFSIGKLLKITALKVSISEWIVFPAVCGGLAYYVLLFLKKLIGFWA
ncbi:MAG: MATE family efflux transporter [Oscillospiraceae bacterium]|jgi:stage V sporulation protein B|nr:MATE family efflux transporter [Oscillospiraceae bacterium]MCI1989776.1 MATE family efflux transporter [Oscillospiraceae bacterium]MCI2034379.1 MATE family efflux transporter [Oscillospiraceae bacterium]